MQFAVQTPALPYLPAMAYYLRQNLLDFVITPKYMDACHDHHFQVRLTCRPKMDCLMNGATFISHLDTVIVLEKSPRNPRNG